MTLCTVRVYVHRSDRMSNLEKTFLHRDLRDLRDRERMFQNFVDETSPSFSADETFS